MFVPITPVRFYSLAGRHPRSKGMFRYSLLVASVLITVFMYIIVTFVIERHALKRIKHIKRLVKELKLNNIDIKDK